VTVRAARLGAVLVVPLDRPNKRNAIYPGRRVSVVVDADEEPGGHFRGNRDGNDPLYSRLRWPEHPEYKTSIG
jgi:hypothetical protein